MSRTDLDPATLAKALRGMAGDGSIEWVMQPIQASVLLDVADALDENDKLRKLVRGLNYCSDELNNVECDRCPLHDMADEWLGPTCERLMEELGIEVDA